MGSLVNWLFGWLSTAVQNLAKWMTPRILSVSAHPPGNPHPLTHALRPPTCAVVAPLTTLGHWQREIETWTDMNCVVYAGASTDREICQVGLVLSALPAPRFLLHSFSLWLLSSAVPATLP